jgi:hypothetical protein
MFGKLSQRSLYAGYRSLNKLEECIQHKGHRKDIENYSNEFYKNMNILHHMPILSIDAIQIKKQEILSMIQAQAEAQAQAQAESHAHKQHSYAVTLDKIKNK